MNGVTKFKIICYIAATFLAGAVAGGVVGYKAGQQRHFKPPKPQEMSESISSTLNTRLQLTPDQLGKIKPLVDQACADIQARSREQRREISYCFEKMDLEIAALLTPSQQDEFGKMQQERRESKGKHGRPRPSLDSSPGNSGSNCPPLEQRR